LTNHKTNIIFVVTNEENMNAFILSIIIFASFCFGYAVCAILASGKIAGLERENMTLRQLEDNKL